MVRCGFQQRFRPAEPRSTITGARYRITVLVVGVVPVGLPMAAQPGRAEMATVVVERRTPTVTKGAQVSITPNITACEKAVGRQDVPNQGGSDVFRHHRLPVCLSVDLAQGGSQRANFLELQVARQDLPVLMGIRYRPGNLTRSDRVPARLFNVRAALPTCAPGGRLRPTRA